VFKKNFDRKNKKAKNNLHLEKEINNEDKENYFFNLNVEKQEIIEEPMESFSLVNYSIENFSIHKSCDFEVILKIDPNHYNIIAKSILEKIKKRFISVKSVYSIIDIEFIVFLKALKFMMEK